MEPSVLEARSPFPDASDVGGGEPSLADPSYEADPEPSADATPPLADRAASFPEYSVDREAFSSADRVAPFPEPSYDRSSLLEPSTGTRVDVEAPAEHPFPEPSVDRTASVAEASEPRVEDHPFPEPSVDRTASVAEASLEMETAAPAEAEATGEDEASSGESDDDDDNEDDEPGARATNPTYAAAWRAMYERAPVVDPTVGYPVEVVDQFPQPAERRRRVVREKPCAFCTKPGTLRCVRCDRPYCTHRCQIGDWQHGHKAECLRLWREQRGLGRRRRRRHDRAIAAEAAPPPDRREWIIATASRYGLRPWDVRMVVGQRGEMWLLSDGTYVPKRHRGVFYEFCDAPEGHRERDFADAAPPRGPPPPPRGGDLDDASRRFRSPPEDPGPPVAILGAAAEMAAAGLERQRSKLSAIVEEKQPADGGLLAAVTAPSGKDAGALLDIQLAYTRRRLVDEGAAVDRARVLRRLRRRRLKGAFLAARFVVRLRRLAELRLVAQEEALGPEGRAKAWLENLNRGKARRADVLADDYAVAEAALRSTGEFQRLQALRRKRTPEAYEIQVRGRLEVKLGQIAADAGHGRVLDARRRTKRARQEALDEQMRIRDEKERDRREAVEQRVAKVTRPISGLLGLITRPLARALRRRPRPPYAIAEGTIHVPKPKRKTVRFAERPPDPHRGPKPNVDAYGRPLQRDAPTALKPKPLYVGPPPAGDPPGVASAAVDGAPPPRRRPSVDRVPPTVEEAPPPVEEGVPPDGDEDEPPPASTVSPQASLQSSDSQSTTSSSKSKSKRPPPPVASPAAPKPKQRKPEPNYPKPTTPKPPDASRSPDATATPPATAIAATPATATEPPPPRDATPPPRRGPPPRPSMATRQQRRGLLNPILTPDPDTPFDEDIAHLGTG